MIKVTITHSSGLQVEYFAPLEDTAEVVSSFERDMYEGSILTVESI